MAVKGEEAPGTAPADAGAQPSPRRSELDLTKRNVGPVWRQYLRAMGPGLVTGASDDDPSGMAQLQARRHATRSLWRQSAAELDELDELDDGGP